MQLSIQQILQATGGKLVAEGRRAISQDLTTDSRAIQPGCIFLALTGERFDGNNFAATASHQGAAAVIVSRSIGEIDPACSVIQVNDTLVALHALASWWRKQLEPLRVVGLTGSSGKTSCKDMALAILRQKYNAEATHGNLNNHIGVPLSILRAKPSVEAAIWEMGMNHVGEIAPLCKIVLPEIGIITNIGSAHIEHMGSREAIAHEKCSLARALPNHGVLIYPAKDDFAGYIAAQTDARCIPCGSSESPVRAEHIRCMNSSSNYKLCIEGLGSIDIHLPVLGAHMVDNSLLAAAAGWQLGCSLTQIAEGLRQSNLSAGRLACYEIEGISLIDDSYNANLESMLAALRTVAALEKPTRRIAVLGQMGELGKHGPEIHHLVGEALCDEEFDILICVGESNQNMLSLSNAAHQLSVHHCPDHASSAALLRKIMQPGDVILFKGSRSAAIERCLHLLHPQLKNTHHA